MSDQINVEVEVNEEFSFGAQSLWSNSPAQNILIDKISIDIVDDDVEDYHWAFLSAYFDSKSWDVKSKGLIYTDLQFEQEIRRFMKAKFGVRGIHFSEQGMQGDTFVHFDMNFEDAKIVAKAMEK